jgi:hypothetical protein
MNERQQREARAWMWKYAPIEMACIVVWSYFKVASDIIRQRCYVLSLRVRLAILYARRWAVS